MLALRNSIGTLAGRSLSCANVGTAGCLIPTNNNDNIISYGNFNKKQSNNLHSLAYKRHIRKQQRQQQQQQSNNTGRSIVPSKLIAKSMPLSYKEMHNESLITLGALGKMEACAEILKRHIMAVDNVPYDDACVVFDQIEKSNLKHMSIKAIPYQIGIGVGMTAAAVSFPLVFHYDTVAWFNEAFVTADVPEPKDLETWLEVGSWSWNWMEPVMGQVSFVLLCLQYARAQVKNLGARPYTSTMKHVRAKRIAQEFPRYDSRIVMDYSKSVKIFVKK